VHGVTKPEQKPGKQEKKVRKKQPVCLEFEGRSRLEGGESAGGSLQKTHKGAHRNEVHSKVNWRNKENLTGDAKDINFEEVRICGRGR